MFHQQNRMTVYECRLHCTHMLANVKYRRISLRIADFVANRQIIRHFNAANYQLFFTRSVLFYCLHLALKL